MLSFDDLASILDARNNFDKSLTDGFKTLKENYKFEVKNNITDTVSKTRKK